MNTQFIAPAVTAMAFHAILIFGLNTKPTVFIEPLSKPTASDTPPPMEINIDDPVPPEEFTSDEPQPKMRKGSEVSPPQSDEPPARPQKDAIEIETPPITRNVRIESNLIPPGVPGDPDGDEESDAVKHSRPFNFSELDGIPRARVQIGPIYPAEARSRGLEGEVLVAFTVDEEGRVINPRVMRSTDAIFDEAARRAVAKWRFEPGRRQGRVVRFSMAVPMVFRVNE